MALGAPIARPVVVVAAILPLARFDDDVSLQDASLQRRNDQRHNDDVGGVHVDLPIGHHRPTRTHSAVSTAFATVQVMNL